MQGYHKKFLTKKIEPMQKILNQQPAVLASSSIVLTVVIGSQEEINQ